MECIYHKKIKTDITNSSPQWLNQPNSYQQYTWEYLFLKTLSKLWSCQTYYYYYYANSIFLTVMLICREFSGSLGCWHGGRTQELGLGGVNAKPTLSPAAVWPWAHLVTSLVLGPLIHMLSLHLLFLSAWESWSWAFFGVPCFLVSEI